MGDRTFPVRGISLRELLPQAVFRGAADIRVTSCCGEARSCRKGDLFIAVTEDAMTADRAMRLARKRGAIGMVANRATGAEDLPLCVVPDSREAYGRICHALAGDPSQQLKVIGITGAHGKTVTSYLIAAVLEAGGYYAGVLGTLGYYDGIKVSAADGTTPHVPVLARWLERMQSNGCTHAVVEVSSRALEEARLAGITLDAACITNLTHDQLDRQAEGKNFREVKERLFQHLAPEAVTVLNADDSSCDGCLRLLDGPMLTIGINEPAEVTATPLEQSRSEQTFLLSAGSETIPVRSTLIGAHSIYNCLTAAAIGLSYGIDLPTIVRGLEAIDKIPGRLERLECGQSFGVFIDEARTVEGLANSLETLRAVTPGRLICVFGGPGERDRAKRSLLGAVAENAADLAVLTTDNPRDEDPSRIAAEILAGFDHPGRVHVEPDRADAICWALNQAQTGDCVLIAGRGNAAHQIIGCKRIPLDDREVARDWLYEAIAPREMFRAGA